MNMSFSQGWSFIWSPCSSLNRTSAWGSAAWYLSPIQAPNCSPTSHAISNSNRRAEAKAPGFRYSGLPALELSFRTPGPAKVITHCRTREQACLSLRHHKVLLASATASGGSRSEQVHAMINDHKVGQTADWFPPSAALEKDHMPRNP